MVWQYPANITAIPNLPREEIVVERSHETFNITNLPYVSDQSRHQKRTASLYRDDIELERSDEGGVFPVTPQALSSVYLAHNTETMIELVTKELTEWAESGIEFSLANISRIKDYIQEYKPYVAQQTEGRILLSLLELLFENHTWTTVSQGQLIALSQELNRFGSGQFDLTAVKTFSKQLFRSNLAILKPQSNEQKEA